MEEMTFFRMVSLCCSFCSCSMCLLNLTGAFTWKSIKFFAKELLSKFMFTFSVFFFSNLADSFFFFLFLFPVSLTKRKREIVNKKKCSNI